LREKEELIAIVIGTSRESASEWETRENESQGLLSVERGEGRENWFQGFGVAPHKRMAS